MKNNNQYRNLTIFSHHPAPYRDYFFNHLKDYFGNFNVVYYYDHAITHKEWDKQTIFNYNVDFLENDKILKIPILGDLHLGVFRYLFKKNTLFVIPGYIPSTSLIILVLLFTLRIPYIYSADTTLTSEDIKKKSIRTSVISTFVKKSKAIWVPGLASERYHQKISLGKVPILKGVYLLDSESLYIKTSPTKLLEHLINSKKMTFLFIGKLIPSRNIVTLCNAFNKLSSIYNSRLIIVGDGPDQEEVEKLIAQNIDIILVDKLPFEQIHFLYSIADCYIHPGSEPYSLAVQEAFYFNLPIIASYKVGATHDLLVDEINGFLLNNTEEQDLYMAMLKMILHPLDDKLLKKENKRIKETFSLSKYLDAFINLLK